MYDMAGEEKAGARTTMFRGLSGKLGSNELLIKERAPHTEGIAGRIIAKISDVCVWGWFFLRAGGCRGMYYVRASEAV